MPDTIEERLRKLRAQKSGQSIEERLAALRAQPQPPPEPPGFLSKIQTGIAQGVLDYGVNPALSLMEAAGGIATGNFRPAAQVAERAIRGAPSTAGFIAAGAPPDPELARIAQQQAQRQRFSPGFEQARLAGVGQELEAAKDPSLSGRLTRGAGQVLAGAVPAVATGLLTGGSIPAIAATTALQSAAQPETLALNVGLGAAPLPVGQAFRAGVNAVRRTFGKGAAQIIEAEALPAATAQVRQSIGEVPPVVGEVSPTIPAPPQAPLNPLQSTFAKLETDNVEQIGEMIANANRRLNKTRTVLGGTKRPITAEERQSSWDDYKRLNQLRPEEQRALSQVLPARNYEPVLETGKAQSLSDIPAGQPNAQLDANLRELEAFFSGQPRIAAETATPAPQIAERIAGMARTPTSPVSLPAIRAEFPRLSKQQFDDEVLKLAEQGQVNLMRHDAPGLLSEADRNALVKVGNDYYTAATVRGPAVNAPLDALNVAVKEAAESVPRSQRIKDELLGLLSLPKSLRSTLDLSYPLRQGAILLLRPFQWRQSGKVIKEMFRGFKTKNFEAINQAIENHPLAERMKTAGVDILEAGGGPLRGEEAFSRPAGSKIAEFVTQKAGKYVGIKQSDQAFATAGNVQRVEAFQQYARLIDKAGLSPEQALKADKAAAQWVNITTGRGGQRTAKAFPGAFELLNYFFFSPRYVASRLNVLNPAMYIKNGLSPGGRVVLKQQMGDLAQYLGVVGTTLYLAKQAGADITLNPHSPDFGKIKMGTWRYDLGAGLSQALRASILIGEDLTKAIRKQKPDHKRTAIDVGKTFLEYKLSPPAGVFRDLVERRTIDKKPFTYTGAAKDLTVPMQWADFVEAFQKEAWGGVLKTLPGAVGVGIQNYESPPIDAAIEKSRPLFTELQRLSKRVSELRKKEGEKDDAFNVRVQQFSANYTRFGQQLLNSPRFQQAPDNIKAIALDRLNERAKHITHREFAFPEIELDANIIMDAAEQSKKNPANQ